MATATVLSRAQYGMEAPLVRVEVDVGSGLPTFTIVGLPEAVVKESRDRVRAAIINSEFEQPAGRITVNLSPADLPKEGGCFDLPIAIGVLIASRQLTAAHLDDCELYGELSLNGELRPIKGALLVAASRPCPDRTVSECGRSSVGHSVFGCYGESPHGCGAAHQRSRTFAVQLRPRARARQHRRR